MDAPMDGRNLEVNSQYADKGIWDNFDIEVHYTRMQDLFGLYWIMSYVKTGREIRALRAAKTPFPFQLRAANTLSKVGLAAFALSTISNALIKGDRERCRK